MLPVGKTVGELQNKPMSAWGNDDIIIGLEFCATMQLRTPLRVLFRHREIHTDRATPPPKIALEMWEGIWMPKTKTYRDLGIDVDEPKSTMASDIGPIPSDGGGYLKFLLEVRQAVEGEGSIEQRRKALANVLAKSAWQKFVRALRGTDAILSYFFPPFMERFPGRPRRLPQPYQRPVTPPLPHFPQHRTRNFWP